MKSLDTPPSLQYVLDEPSKPASISKKPWISPKLLIIAPLSISNNLSGSGDGDAAFAHS